MIGGTICRPHLSRPIRFVSARLPTLGTGWLPIPAARLAAMQSGVKRNSRQSQSAAKRKHGRPPRKVCHFLKFFLLMWKLPSSPATKIASMLISLATASYNSEELLLSGFSEQFEVVRSRSCTSPPLYIWRKLIGYGIRLKFKSHLKHFLLKPGRMDGQDVRTETWAAKLGFIKTYLTKCRLILTSSWVLQGFCPRVTPKPLHSDCHGLP